MAAGDPPLEPRAHLAWIATSYLFAAYLVCMLWWTFVSHLGILGTVGALVLWAMEAFAAFLGVAYLWELCAALGREAWSRRVPEGARSADATPSSPVAHSSPATAGPTSSASAALPSAIVVISSPTQSATSSEPTSEPTSAPTSAPSTTASP